MPLLRESLGFTFARIEVEPSAPSISEIVVTKVTDSSTPLFMEDDTFDFQPQFTTEPTAPEAGKHEGARDWIKVESWGLADNAGADGKGYALTSVQHWATEESQIGDTLTFTATVDVNYPSLI